MSHPSGWLECGWLKMPCQLGRAGMVVHKREGDGGTPVGAWTLEKCLYRRDRVRRPQIGIPTCPISKKDGWGHQPFNNNYNRAVRYFCAQHAEPLWRKNHQYDVIIVLDYNFCPRVQGGGSAIFLHAAQTHRPSATQGCIAVSPQNLKRLLAVLSQVRVRKIFVGNQLTLRQPLYVVKKNTSRLSLTHHPQ